MGGPGHPRMAWVRDWPRTASSLPLRLAFGGQRLFIDSSTIDVSTSLATSHLAPDVATLGGAFVDVPVSAGVVGVLASMLTFMLGFRPDVLARAKLVLSLMVSRVLH